MRRSLFSKLLLSNWLLLLVLLVVAGAVLFAEKFVHSDFKILLFSFYVLFVYVRNILYVVLDRQKRGGTFG